MSRWPFLILLVIILLSAAWRFTHLAQPDKIVGDEVYFANFARAYVSHQPVHDVHPPLGKLLLAGGVAAFDFIPFGWRFFSAVFGTLLLFAAYAFAKAFFRSPWYGLFFAAGIAFDGLFFVESRLGLINVYYLFFLLLSYAAAFMVHAKPIHQRFRWLMLSGLSFALAVSVKWVALAAVFPLLFLYFGNSLFGNTSPSTNIKKKILNASLAYIALPLISTVLFWQLHFWLSGEAGSLLSEHLKIFSYHSQLTESHTYASPWWTWPFLLLPFPYLLQKTMAGIEVITTLPNPAIWWPALVLFGLTIRQQIRRAPGKTAFLFCAIVFHWIPFAFIQRPMFLYHGAALFLFLLLIALQGVSVFSIRTQKRLLMLWIFVIIGVFLYLFPLYNGDILTNQLYDSRRILPSWHPSSATLPFVDPN